MEPRRKLQLLILVGAGLLLVTLAHVAPSLYYSMWLKEEEHYLVRAVGFLGGDLNPYWLGYHTLPMYLLSIVYYAVYIAYLTLDLVDSKLEFASMLFSDHRVFALWGRFFFAGAYTLGCFAIYLSAKRLTRANILPLAIFLASGMLVDSVWASNRMQGDTFVFLFVSFSIYYACWAPKNQRNFILSVVFCAAAFASKVSAIVVLPVLLASLVVDIHARVYPKRYLPIAVCLWCLSVVVMMPYIVLDHTLFINTMAGLIERASGTFVHFGKAHNETSLDQIGAILGALRSQVGFPILVMALLAPLFAFWKLRPLFRTYVFTMAQVAVYATSNILDSYWLRSVYPWLIFLAAASSIVVVPEILELLQRKVRNRQFKKYSKLVPGMLVIVIVVLVANGGGIHEYRRWLDNKLIDSRVLAAEWIRDNIPPGAKIVLEGHLSHYLPRVTGSETVSLQNSGLNARGFITKSEFIHEAFRHYHQAQLKTGPVFDVELMRRNMANRYAKGTYHIPAGSYVVISGLIYNRFYRKVSRKKNPVLAAQAQAFYEQIRSQELIKRIEGGRTIVEIYLVSNDIGAEQIND